MILAHETRIVGKLTRYKEMARDAKAAYDKKMRFINKKIETLNTGNDTSGEDESDEEEGNADDNNNGEQVDDLMGGDGFQEYHQPDFHFDMQEATALREVFKCDVMLGRCKVHVSIHQNSV